MFEGNCLVINVGVSVEGRTEVKLRPQPATATFTADQWFQGNAKVSREILAIALAAMTSNKVVFCSIADETKAYTEVTRFILRND